MFGSKARMISSLQEKVVRKDAVIADLHTRNAAAWKTVADFEDAAHMYADALNNLEEELEIAALEYAELERLLPVRDERGRFRRQ